MSKLTLREREKSGEREREKSGEREREREEWREIEIERGINVIETIAR